MTCPSIGVYFTALDIRLSSIWRSMCESPMSLGRPAVSALSETRLASAAARGARQPSASAVMVIGSPAICREIEDVVDDLQQPGARVLQVGGVHGALGMPERP